jgi:hypothetical protein
LYFFNISGNELGRSPVSHFKYTLSRPTETTVVSTNIHSLSLWQQIFWRLSSASVRNVVCISHVPPNRENVQHHNGINSLLRIGVSYTVNITTLVQWSNKQMQLGLLLHCHILQYSTSRISYIPSLHSYLRHGINMTVSKLCLLTTCFGP